MGEYDMERKGFWHESSGTPTSAAKALEAWVTEAHQILRDAAHEYHGVVRDDHLAEWIQDRSGVRTSRHHSKWMPSVLAPVISLCEHHAEPPLVALVVSEKNRRVGEWYDEWRRSQGFAPIEGVRQREKHAAQSRLACYEWAGVVPEDGGVPAPRATPRRRTASPAASTRPTSTRPATPRVAKSDRPVNVCPRCFMAIPATGVCDTCD